MFLSVDGANGFFIMALPEGSVIFTVRGNF